MKVIYINHSSGIQGAGLALLNIVHGIMDHGVEPIVVLPNEGPLADNFRAMGIKVYLVMHYNAIFPQNKGIVDYLLYPYRLIRTLFYNKLVEYRFRSIIIKEDPNIIHSNSGVIRFGAKIAKKQDIPHVWHIREFQSKDFFGTPLGGEERVRWLYSSDNNYCIAITKAIFKHFELNSHKDCVIYDGVFSKIKHLSKKSVKKYFLFVGSLQKGKGIYDALAAFDSVADQIPDFELWIAGKDYVNINHVISAQKNSRQIKYLGFRSDIYDLMADATAVLVPSYYEGFGFITVEAMLNKTIVIGRDVAGTKEQFDNGLDISGKEIGIRFQTTEDLANAILKVSNTPIEWYKEMIASAYAVAPSCEYPWSR